MNCVKPYSKDSYDFFFYSGITSEKKESTYIVAIIINCLQSDKYKPDIVFNVAPCWGAWEAQLVKCGTLGFGSGCNLEVMRSCPVLGYALSGESAWNCFSLFLSLSAPPPAHALSFSLK